MFDSMASTTTSVDDEAERLRLKGNDAFATKDWTRAVDLYRRSVALGGNNKTAAKTNSNLAATLCKLSRFDEANSAAERATTLDPTWAKAWWRRGVCAELQKLFVDSLRFYQMAVDLDPSEKVFCKALRDMEKRLQVKETVEGFSVVEDRRQLAGDEAKKQASYVAWERLQSLVGSSVRVPGMEAYTDVVYYPTLQTKYPTSEQWLIHGLADWTKGLKSAVADLSTAVNPEARRQFQALQQQGLPPGAYIDQAERLLGGVPDGKPLAGLAAGFAHLGGLNIPLESGTPRGDEEAPSIRLCPQPRHLSFQPMYQSLALMFSVQVLLQHVVKQLGTTDFKSSQAVIAASSTFYANLRGQQNEEPDGGIPASPEEVVEYIKEQLQVGKTWDGGLRTFVSLQYRGTIIYAALLRMMDYVAESYKFEKWAAFFIKLADKEFKVTEEETYDEKGSCFRHSFRIGMMVSRLHSFNSLRGVKIDGPYPMSGSLHLCVGIVQTAGLVEIPPQDRGELTEYHRIQHDVAWRRKPLAVAHSIIASHLNTLAHVCSREDFHEIVAFHGIIEEEDGELVDPYALIVDQYRLAAKAELPDADEAAIFWWGVGANMARAEEKSGYTLGDLCSAIKMAEECEKARDDGLFGPNLQRGATFETLSKLTADFYKNEPDSFVLPQVEIVTERSRSLLKVGDEVICEDYEAYEKKEMALFLAKREKQNPKLMDTSNVEKEFGPARDELVPSLETLCIRQLHKSENEFAVGESDGAVIICKAMMAAENASKA